MSCSEGKQVNHSGNYENTLKNTTCKCILHFHVQEFQSVDSRVE